VRASVLNQPLVRRATFIGVAALLISAAFGASATSAPLGTATPSTGGVFVVTYSPLPLTSALSEVRVRFSTTGRAQPGWEYYVYLSMQRPKAKKPRCAHKAASWVPSMVRHVPHISGVSGGTYTVWLRAAKDLGGHFCAGQAVLEVGTGPAGHLGSRRRPLRRIPLTVIRAH
jgi:hypothetical protein